MLQQLLQSKQNLIERDIAEEDIPDYRMGYIMSMFSCSDNINHKKFNMGEKVVFLKHIEYVAKLQLRGTVADYVYCNPDNYQEMAWALMAVVKLGKKKLHRKIYNRLFEIMLQSMSEDKHIAVRTRY